jgi:microcompartment protein CcmL/EutN
MRDGEALTAAMKLGAEAEAFIVSPLGKFLIQRAEDQIETAVEALKRCDPDDAKAIRAVQNEIRIAEDVQYWLAEAVQAGHNAISALEMMDAPD